MRATYVLDAARTPFGRLGGGLVGVRPFDQAAHVPASSVRRVPALEPVRIDEVILRNVNGAGQESRCVARMATLLAGLPTSIPGTKVNRHCGSPLDVAIIGNRQIAARDADVVFVDGAEWVSRAPCVMPKTDRPYPTTDLALNNTALGWRLVNPAIADEWTISMGETTEQLRVKHGISSDRRDAFAERPHALAAPAWSEGRYEGLFESLPGTSLTRDESIMEDTLAYRRGTLATDFRGGTECGRITAGNSSPLSDGASALWLGSEDATDILGPLSMARIAPSTAAAKDPRDFGYAPAEAVNTALCRARLFWSDIGAIELNEAFAAQSLACLDAWGVDPEIANAWGGAIAMGRQPGASGGRVLGTLVARLRACWERCGVAAICIGVGPGPGLATVVENVASSGTVKSA